MKWIARLGDREETVEVGQKAGSEPVGEDLAPARSVPARSTERRAIVTVGDEVLDLDVGEDLASSRVGLTRTHPGRAQDPPLHGATGGGLTTNRETSVIHNGRQYEVMVLRQSASRYQVSINGRRYEVTVDDQLGFLTREAAEAHGGKGGTVTAYMPGKVAAVLVEEGAEVKAGDGVVVLEAMKMENEIQADVDGVVSKVYVERGQAVEGGDALFEVVVSGQ